MFETLIIIVNCFTDEKLTMSTPKGALLFVTPVGQAYTCLREVEVKLTNPKSEVKASVLLRELEVQPFIFKNSNFGPGGFVELHSIYLTAIEVI